MSRFRLCKKLSMESLSDRIAPAASLQGGQLVILGTNLSDYCFVWEFGVGSMTTVQCNLNGVVNNFPKANMPKGIAFYGYNGDDYLNCSANAVVYSEGGAGNDVLIGGAANDALYGGKDNDSLIGNSGDDFLFGEDGNDTLDGGNGSDAMHGNAGNDSMLGGNEGDWMYGGSDDDSMDGGSGNDLMLGEFGDDNMKGGADKDQLQGGFDDDFMAGGDSNDTMFGELGNDRMFGDDGHDFLRGDQDNDQLYGGAGSDRLEGSDGDDDMYGQAGFDTLRGGNGDDGLCGGRDLDNMRGGEDDDRFLFHVELGVSAAEEFDDFDSNEDAQISFSDGEGVDGKTWTDAEVEAVDAAIAKVHHHPMTQNTRLLRDRDGYGLSFVRYSSMSAEKVPEGYDLDLTQVGTWNFDFGVEGSWAEVYDVAFSRASLPDIVRSIGRQWASGSVNHQWDEFKGISGWTQDEPDPLAAGMEEAQGGWFYLADTGFVSDFGKLNPVEDWADCFAYFFLTSDTHDDADVQAKLDEVGIL